MQPATVIRWHRTAFRLYWRRKSRGRPGRPPISREMQALIRKLSRENLELIDGPRKLISFPVCGGLHHRYERVAA